MTPNHHFFSLRVTPAAKTIAMIGVVGIIAAYVVSKWSLIRALDPPRPDYLLWSAFTAVIVQCIAAWNLQQLLSAQGYNIPFQRAIALRFLPMLGRYVPGKIWAMVGAYLLYVREQVPKSVAATNVLIVNVVGITSGIILAMIIGSTHLQVSPLLILFIIALAIASLYPPVFLILATKLQPLLGEANITMRLRYTDLLKYFFINLAVHAAYGAAFYLLTKSFSEIEFSDIWDLTAIFAVAQVAGFLAFFAPSGIGVREGILIAGLTPNVGEGTAIAISITCRIWQTFIELAMSGWGFIAIQRKLQKEKAANKLA